MTKVKIKKGMTNFRGFIVRDYSDRSIIKGSEDSGSVTLDLNDTIKTSKCEDINFKDVYDYILDLSSDIMNDNKNKDICEANKINSDDDKVLRFINIKKCTIENMEKVYQIKNLKSKDITLSKNLEIIFTYGKHLLKWYRKYIEMVVLKYKNDDNIIMYFTFTKGQMTSVPSCTCCIVSKKDVKENNEETIKDEYHELNEMFDVDEFGVRLPNELFYKHIYNTKLYGGSTLFIKDAFSYFGFVSSKFYEDACNNNPKAILDGFDEKDYEDPNVVGQKMFNYVVDGILRYLYDLSNKDNQLFDETYTRMELDTASNRVFSSLLFKNSDEIEYLDNMYDWDDINTIIDDISEIDKVAIDAELIYAIYHYMIHILKYFTKYSRIWNRIVDRTESSIGTLISYDDFNISITTITNTDEEHTKLGMNNTVCLVCSRPAYDHMNRHRDDAVEESTIIHDNKSNIVNSIGLFGFDSSMIRSMSFDVTNDVIQYTLSKVINDIKDNNVLIDSLSIIPFYVNSIIGIKDNVTFDLSKDINLPSIENVYINMNDLRDSIKSFNRISDFDNTNIDKLSNDNLHKMFNISKEVLEYLIKHIKETFNNATWINHDMINELEYLIGVHFALKDKDDNIIKDTIHSVSISINVLSDLVSVYYNKKVVK